MDDDLKQYIAERRKALIQGDMVWMSRQIHPHPSPDDPALIMAFHRVRYHAKDVPDAFRHTSARWLRTRGYGDLHGLPLLPEGMLPP